MPDQGAGAVLPVSEWTFLYALPVSEKKTCIFLPVLPISEGILSIWGFSLLWTEGHQIIG